LADCLIVPIRMKYLPYSSFPQKYLPYVLACADGMLRYGSTGPKVYELQSINKLGFKAFELVTADGKLSAKYDDLRKRLDEDKIIFAFVSDYFYRYHFCFFVTATIFI